MLPGFALHLPESMKKKSTPSGNIEWGNHFVSFLSALLGIFIALQLEEWRENRAEVQRAKEAIAAIKAESDSNIALYRYNIQGLKGQAECLRFFRTHESKGFLLANPQEFEALKSKYPKRFQFRMMEKINDSLNRYEGEPRVDFLPNSGFSSSAWHSAEISGILPKFSQDKISALTFIYDWVNKDLGFSDADFFARIISRYGNISDIREVERNYSLLAEIYEFKLRHIQERYEKMNWQTEP